MPLLQASWQLSVGLAVTLAVVAVVARLAARGSWAAATSRGRLRAVRSVGAFAQEFTFVLLLFALWQRVGAAVHTRVDGAIERGRAIDALQHRLHLPDQVALQHAVLPHPLLVRALNAYYEFGHLNSMTVFVVWLWWRHREAYPRARFIIVASTLTSLLIQIVPVAPPRLLPDLGFVDTASLYGQSVYGSLATGLANQLSAMPSVHVAWAVIVGGFVWTWAPARWRWIGPLHTGLTVLAVTATANHWWLDGVAAAGIDAAAVGVYAAAVALRGVVLRSWSARVAAADAQLPG